MGMSTAKPKHLKLTCQQLFFEVYELESRSYECLPQAEAAAAIKRLASVRPEVAQVRIDTLSRLGWRVIAESESEGEGESLTHIPMNRVNSNRRCLIDMYRRQHWWQRSKTRGSAP